MGLAPTRLDPISGKGITNRIIVAEFSGTSVVVRLGTNGLGEFEKEWWCLGRAAKVGIPVPEAISLGTKDGFAYLVQRFIQGGYARIIQDIPVIGYGDQLADPITGLFATSFSPTWEQHLQYNIASLDDGDPLARLGAP